MKSAILSAAAMIVAAGLGSTAFGAIVDSTLQGYWKLNETSGTTVTNSGTVAQNGSIVTNVTPNATGQIGKAYNFAGNLETVLANNGTTVAARVNLGGALGSDVINNIVSNGVTDTTATNNSTFSAWINPIQFRTGTNAASRSTIFGVGSSQLALSLVAGGDVRFDYNSDGSTKGVSSTANTKGLKVQLNQWSHVVATRGNNGTELNLYLNGVNIGTLAVTSGNFTAAADVDSNGDAVSDVSSLHLGVLPAGTSSNIRDFSGNIDEAAIYTGRALTQVEVAAIAGLGRYSGAALDNTGIDSVIGVFNAQTGTASVGGFTYSYTTFDPASTASLFLGSHFLSAGKPAIILGGTAGAYTGVVGTAIPEPTTLAALGVAALGMGRRRR